MEWGHRMPSATTAARNGRHFLRTVDIALLRKWGADRLLGWVNLVPCARLTARRPDWTARSGQVEAQPRRRKSVLNPEMARALPGGLRACFARRASTLSWGLPPLRAASGRCGSRRASNWIGVDLTAGSAFPYTCAGGRISELGSPSDARAAFAYRRHL
jgi:hypothetical protein